MISWKLSIYMTQYILKQALKGQIQVLYLTEPVNTSSYHVEWGQLPMLEPYECEPFFPNTTLVLNSVFLTYSKFISRRCLIGYSQGDVRLDTNSHKVLNKSSFGVYWRACSSTGCFTLLFTWALHWSLHVFLQVQSTASWPKCVYCLTQKSHLLFSALNSVMDLEFRSLLEDLSQTVTSSMPVPCARGPPEHCPPTKHSVFSLKQECKSNDGIFCNFSILQLIPLPLPNSTIMSVFSTWPWPTLTTKTTYVYHHSQNYIVAAQQWPWYHHSLVRSRHLNNLLKFRYSGTFWLGLEKLFGLGLNRYIFYVTSLTYIHN